MAWFTDEAIAQNIKTTDVYNDAAPISAKTMGLGIRWLQEAARYRVEIPLIPRSTEERFDAKVSRFAHGLVMPTKYCLIEYEHGGNYDMKPDLTRALSTRRIALCVDLESEMGVDMASVEGFVRDEDDDGGILVWSLNYFDEKREWEFAPGVAIIGRRQVREVLRASPAGKLERGLDVLRAALGKARQDDTQLHVRYLEVMPEICDQLGAGHREKVVREMNMDAMWVALGFFSAYGCENVHLNGDHRALFVSDDSSASAVSPVDPYRGERRNTVSGRARWEQNVTMDAST